MKIKVLHVLETIGSGGVEITRLSLAKHLDKNLFDLKIVCQHEVGNVGHQIRQQGVEVICLERSIKNVFDLAQHKKIQQIIDDFKPDIIHGAVFEGVTMAAVNGWLKKVPSIIIEETSDPQNRSWRGNLLMRIFSKMSHKVIGVSESVSEEYLKGKLQIPSNKVVLVNNGVALPIANSETEIAAERIKWGIAENDFVIGTVGRMKNDEHKRFSDLIKAFARFSAGKENVKLLMVGGNNEYLEKYIILADELEVSHKIIFTAYQSNVSLFYRLMNVFTLVSAYEAFGLVLAEAMLNKLPVIATKVGGMKYIVDHNETGILVEKFNIDEIANAFLQIYNDKKLGQKMGERGYFKAIREYTEQTYVDKMQTLYLNLCGYKNK